LIEYPHTPYGPHFVADSMGLPLFKFLQWAQKYASFLQHSAYRPFKVIQVSYADTL